MARTAAQYFKVNRKYQVGGNWHWVRQVSDEGILYTQNVSTENTESIDWNIAQGYCVARSCVDSVFDAAISDYINNLGLEITLCQTCEDAGVTAPSYVGICSRCSDNLSKFTTLKTIALG